MNNMHLFENNILKMYAIIKHNHIYKHNVLHEHAQKYTTVQKFAVLWFLKEVFNAQKAAFILSKVTVIW